ncbi:MAG: hypothetical protein ACPGQS_12190 [Bradymonadia bacterium]
MRIVLIFAIALCAWTDGIGQPISPKEPSKTAQKIQEAPPVDGKKDQEASKPVISLPAGIDLPRVSRQCSPESPRIGTQISCVVNVRHTKDFSISIAVPNGFDAHAQTVNIDSEVADMLVTTRQIFTTPLSMRKLKLFGFTASWTHETGAKGVLTLKDEYMAMSSMMASVDEPLFRTFRRPTSDFDTFWSAHGGLPLIVTNWVLLIALSVFVLGSLFAMLALYIQRVRARRRLAEVPWVDPRPAHVIANEALEQLAAENLPENGEILAFYLRLSDILRVFLENRFGIAIKRGLDDSGRETGLRFTAATTEEIESVLQDHVELTSEGFKTLMECFGMIDYVVFGGVRPHVGQTEADRRQIRFCIDLNKAPDVSTESDSEDASRPENDHGISRDVVSSLDREDRGVTDAQATSSEPNRATTLERGEEL